MPLVGAQVGLARRKSSKADDPGTPGPPGHSSQGTQPSAQEFRITQARGPAKPSQQGFAFIIQTGVHYLRHFTPPLNVPVRHDDACRGETRRRS
jgi:hypothetical protein